MQVAGVNPKATCLVLPNDGIGPEGVSTHKRSGYVSSSVNMAVMA
jgi:hypothetical protein